MKLAALALDYDGTIAVDGVLDPGVREAIADARQRGIAVILVTGRRLVGSSARRRRSDLLRRGRRRERRRAGFPRERPPRGPRPSAVSGLRRSSCGVAASTSPSAKRSWRPTRTSAAAALDVLRQLEQPLDSRVQSRPSDGVAAGGRQVDRAPPGAGRPAAVDPQHGRHRRRGERPRSARRLRSRRGGRLGQPGAPRRRRRSDRRHRSRRPSPTTFAASRNSLGCRRRKWVAGGCCSGIEHNGEPVSLAVRGRTMSDRRRARHRQVVAGWSAVRAADPPGLLPLHHRSRRRLPIARSAAECHHAGRRRSAAECARAGQGAAPPGCQRHRRSVEAVASREDRIPARRCCRCSSRCGGEHGLPHKILLDEAHYYLGGADSSRAHRLGARRATSWSPIVCPASPTPSGRTSDAVVMVTRETDPDEAATLLDDVPAPAMRGVSARAFSATSPPTKPRCCRAPKNRRDRCVGSSWRPG